MNAPEEREMNCVTYEECQSFRQEIYKDNQKQDLTLTRIETKVAIFEKLAWSILAVLVSGFVGTIFSVLSLK